MTNKDEIDDITSAREILSDWCSNQGKKFTMSIPVNESHDSDMIMKRVIDEAEKSVRGTQTADAKGCIGYLCNEYEKSEISHENPQTPLGWVYFIVHKLQQGGYMRCVANIQKTRRSSCVSQNTNDRTQHGLCPVGHTQKNDMIPEGWQLVPIQPTQHMERLGQCVHIPDDSYNFDGRRTAGCGATRIYNAMLAAAPKKELI